jgi:hypothetical protein
VHDLRQVSGEVIDLETVNLVILRAQNPHKTYGATAAGGHTADQCQ